MCKKYKEKGWAVKNFLRKQNTKPLKCEKY